MLGVQIRFKNKVCFAIEYNFSVWRIISYVAYTFPKTIQINWQQSSVVPYTDYTWIWALARVMFVKWTPLPIRALSAGADTLYCVWAEGFLAAKKKKKFNIKCMYSRDNTYYMVTIIISSISTNIAPVWTEFWCTFYGDHIQCAHHNHISYAICLI